MLYKKPQLIHGKAQYYRDHQKENPPDTGMARINARLIAQADPADRRELDQELGSGTHHYAHGKADNAEPLTQQKAADNDHHIIHHRSQGGGKKALVRIKDTHADAVQRHKKGLGQHDSGHGHRQIDVFRLKARHQEVFHDIRRQNSGDHDAQKEYGHHNIEDSAGYLPALILPVCRDIAGENGNKGRADRAAHQQGIQKVRDRKSRQVGVRHLPLAIGRGDDDVPDVSQHPG